MTQSAVHFLLSAACGVAFSAGLFGQTLAPKPPAVQHVTVATGGAWRTAATGQVMLHLDVTPKPGIHVYAAGANEFTAVSLVVTPRAGLRVGSPAYPPAHPAPPLSGDDVPAYRAPFRIAQPITLAAPTAESVTVSGVLTYQACDERLCYPVASLPVSWTIKTQ